MEISLIRHGKSSLNDNKRKNCEEFKEWINKYNLNGVVEEENFPETTFQKVALANVLVTSDLKRSIDSARFLRSNGDVMTDPLFREVELPVPSIKLRMIKLSPSVWSVLLRLLWFSGYSNNCESYTHAKFRAKQAANQLIDYAKNYHSVVLVGHGFLNMLIANELLNMGWEGKKMKSSKHWSVSSFTLINESEGKRLMY
ncbi:histidine phosphatase family protein [Bacillus sp. UMB0899]|uniref:histidine phosphatase family protein n=1 Tax=Metabacillus schmidteae TaxID=2730405 RepID=UPI000C805CFF|nr:histidine phosphatase family protein [Metabacillus schmidteae]PMC39077.1 histidine phosphatase family protein [Bacillus sp. UMB0899]